MPVVTPETPDRRCVTHRPRALWRAARLAIGWSLAGLGSPMVAAQAPAAASPSSSPALPAGASASAPAPAAASAPGASPATDPVLRRRAVAEPSVDKRLVPMRGGDEAAPAPVQAADQQPGRPPVRLPDPMDRLRERLSQRLGASQAAPGTAQTPPVMRVDNQAKGEITIDGGRARVARPRSPEPVARARDRARGAGAATTAAPAASEKPKAWTYEGAETGPMAWASLQPGYALCGNGQRQSPIDIRDGIGVDLPPIHFDYRPGFFSVLDNGHTIEVRVAPGNTLEVGTRRFELEGFRFHHPGEGAINGTMFPMSIHLVHKDAQGQLAVLALLAENWSDDAEHPVVQQVWNHLPLERGEAVPAPVQIDPAGLLPARRGYFTYMGSLTTPPCTEGVLWMVMQQSIPVSKAQLAILARLHPMNARPVQPLNGRLIKQSR